MSLNRAPAAVFCSVLVGILAGCSLLTKSVLPPEDPAFVAAWPSRAQWIGLDSVQPVISAEGRKMPNGKEDKRVYKPATYLRRAFEAAAVERAVLRVTAEGFIVPYLNGARVGDDYFTPGWSDYHKRLYFRAYDVTALLKDGANVLGAVLGDGWFRGNICWMGQNKYGDRTRAKMELALTMKDGSRRTVVTDAAWRAVTGPILEGDIYAGEHYDARLEMPGWAAPGFDDSAWKPADVGNSNFEPAVIEPHPAPAVRVVAEVPAKAVTEPKKGVYVFDLGQNFAGIERLSVAEPAGTKIVLRFAEMLNADGTVYVENLRTARATDTYVCRGGGRETWSPLLTFHGFRYVEVTGLTKKPALSAVIGLALSTGMRRTGAFECSNPLVNQIYRNTWWGQLSNYLEVPTDCPQRDERLGWSGDTQVFSRSGLYNADAAAFLGKWLTDLDDAQDAKQGYFTDTAPFFCGTWSPAWSDAGIVVPHEIWSATGDRSCISNRWTAMNRYMDFCTAQAPDGIGPDHGYGDWLAIGMETPRPLIFTAYYAHDAYLMHGMAAAIGDTAAAAKYAALFEKISAAFRAKFVNADGTIGKDSSTGYLLALRFGLLEPAQRQAAVQNLVRVVESYPDRMCGFVGVNLLLPTLADIGRADLAYRLLEKKTYPGWGYSVEQGATTMWERWNSYTKDKGFGPVGMNSFNHYAYGSCVEWLYEGILGISAVTPGYGKVRIAPEVGGGLTWAKGSYDSVRGRIAVSWRVEGKKFFLDVDVPAGVGAEVVLPDGTERTAAGKAAFICSSPR